MVVLCHTFLFADLCDYTEHSFRHGDDAAAELAVGFHVLVKALAEEEGCDVIKTIGDAVMVRANDVADAVRLADRIHASTRVLGYPSVRIGIDTGPAAPRSGDWYGTTVNRAARVADAARPGELLMTDGSRAALGAGPQHLQLVPRGVRKLKGLPRSRVYAACLSTAAVAAG